MLLRPQLIQADGALVYAEEEYPTQFRLDETFPSLPAGAVEQFLLDLMVQGDENPASASFVLRLHGATKVHEFPFDMEFTWSADSEDESAAAEME